MNKNDSMKDQALPGFENIIEERERIETEEESRFYKLLFKKLDAGEYFLLCVSAGKDYIQNAGHLAEKYNVELPPFFKERFEKWEGRDSFEAIKKVDSSKFALEIIKHIHTKIPLSLKGMKTAYGGNNSLWTRESDGMRFSLYIPLSAETEDMKPAAGDLAKRTVMAILKMGYHRRTAAPGALKFKELLEILGMPYADKKDRGNIKKYCESSAHTSLTVYRLDEKGERNYYHYTPFFKKFEWIGKLEDEAKIYPVFNEYFEKLIREQNVHQYTWLAADRLRRLKGASDRDRLAQDQFLMLKGLNRQDIRMYNFLNKFGQFTEKELYKMSLKQIKEWIDKVIETAKRTGLLLDASIGYPHNKKKYLNQIISLWPERQKIKTIGRELTQAEHETAGRFVYLAYHIADRLTNKKIKLYLKKPEEESREQVENYIRAHGKEIVDIALDTFEDTLDDPFCESPGGPVGQFWDTLRKYKNQGERQAK